MNSTPITCDGCGLPQPESHLSRRIRRLELCTRFRPIHISILFLSLAPAPRLEDFFYTPAANPDERSPASRFFFQELLTASGISAGEKPDEAALAEFQRAGYFLAHAVECPLEEFPAGEGNCSPSLEDLARRFAATLVRRITFSYKPRHILPLCAELSRFLPAFTEAGLSGQLLLHDGQPLPLPDSADPASANSFRDALASLLSRARSAARSA